MEDNATQHGQPLESPEAIQERLRRLEEEAAELRASLESAASPISQDPVASVEAPEALDGTPESEPDSQPDSATLEKVDKLLQRYRLESARGNRDMGAQYLKEAQSLAPKASAVLEVLGDDALDRRQNKQAIDFYRAAKEANPHNASADKKHADLVFRTQAIASGMSMSEFENMASARSASILSVIVPGLGHIVTGQLGKGMAYLLVWVGAVIWAVLTRNGVQGIIAMMTNRTEPKLNMVFFIPVFIGISTWLAAMIDMNSRSKMIGRTIGKGGAPKPPVDLPF